MWAVERMIKLEIRLFFALDRIFLMKSVLVIKTFLIFARELYISY